MAENKIDTITKVLRYDDPEQARVVLGGLCPSFNEETLLGSLAEYVDHIIVRATLHVPQPVTVYTYLLSTKSESC